MRIFTLRASRPLCAGHVWTCCPILAATLVVVTLVTGNVVQSGEQPTRFGDLLSRVPAGANTLMMVDVEAIRNSPFMANTPQAAQMKQDAMNRFIFCSRSIDRAVLASRIDLIEASSLWETALVTTNFDPVLADIVRQVDGRIEQLGGVQSVWLPSNGYLVPFTPRLIGMRFPGDRQFVSTWANHPAIQGMNALSPYLQQASRYPENVGTEIIMAIDLENVFDPGAVRQKLEESKAVENRDVDWDELTRMLASIRGVTLGIRVTTQINGSLRLDFEKDVTRIEDFAKPLIREKLALFGASVDEFYEWEPRVTENALFLSGPLSVKGLRRVFMVIDPPTPELTPDEPDEYVEEDTEARRTYNYFQALQPLINDAKNPNPRSWVGTGEIAIWLDRYARRIDRLPILGVDEQLVDFAAMIAQAFRDMAVQFRGVGINVSTMSNNPRVSWAGYSGGAWGIARTSMAPSNVARRVGRANVSGNRAEMWRQIDDDMAAARRDLTRRHGIEF